jgi:hypothetical protein
MLHRATTTDVNAKSFIRMKTAQAVDIHKQTRPSHNLDENIFE